MMVSKPASSRQIGYIERLKAENGGTGPSIGTDIIDLQMSQFMQRLTATQNGEINQLRLSLAMKECFRLWTGLGRDVYSEHRETFIGRTIETYQLFIEVAKSLNAKILEDCPTEPDL